MLVNCSNVVRSNIQSGLTKLLQFCLCVTLGHIDRLFLIRVKQQLDAFDLLFLTMVELISPLESLGVGIFDRGRRFGDISPFCTRPAGNSGVSNTLRSDSKRFERVRSAFLAGKTTSCQSKT